MATLTLDRTWITLHSTGVSISGYSGRDREWSQSTNTEVRTYAGGRQRAVTSEGVSGSYTFTLRFVSEADVNTLISWMGQTVLIRDNWGRKFYGVVSEIPPRELLGLPYQSDVPIAVRFVSVDEEV
jgi:hypothetical protein